jgi:hypothetical protein
MPIQLGNTNIKKAYLGATEVTKAYLGNVLVFGGGDYPLANIISEYKFENNTLDTVGTNDGTPTDITYTAGLVGQTGVFNGSTSFVDTGFLPPTGSDARSFTLLFKQDSQVQQYKTILEYGASGTSQRFSILLNNNLIRFEFQGSGKTGSTINANQWYHLSYTYDGINSNKLFINGVEDILYTRTLNTGVTNNLGIGKDVVLNLSRFFIGDIDCVRIWNKELTPTEVSDIATAELAGTDINP